MIRIQLPQDIKVGDVLTRVYRGSREPVEVTRVGRKYLTVKLYSREYPFDKATGFRKEGLGAFSDRLMTEDMIALSARIDSAYKRLESFSIDSWRVGRHVNHVETLEAVADLLEKDGEK